KAGDRVPVIAKCNAGSCGADLPAMLDALNATQDERDAILGGTRNAHASGGALSANVDETPTPWEFSVEGETGFDDVHEPGGVRDDGGDRGGGEGGAAAVLGRREA